MLTQEQYKELSKKDKPTDAELESLKAYDDANNNDNSTLDNNPTPQTSNSDDNNTPNSTNPIDDIHKQDPQKLKNDLHKKEKSAKYQEEQKKKREEENPEDKETASNGLLKSVAWFVLIGGVLVYAYKKYLGEGVSPTSTEKKTASTGNGTESGERETEQRAGTMKEVFNV